MNGVQTNDSWNDSCKIVLCVWAVKKVQTHSRDFKIPAARLRLSPGSHAMKCRPGLRLLCLSSPLLLQELELMLEVEAGRAGWMQIGSLWGGVNVWSETKIITVRLVTVSLAFPLSSGWCFPPLPLRAFFSPFTFSVKCWTYLFNHHKKCTSLTNNDMCNWPHKF